MKKFISMAVAAMMGLSAVPALGAEVATEVILDGDARNVSPEQAIAVAKTTFDIPEELSEFSYNVEVYANDQMFYLTWSSPDYEKSVEVVINSHLVPTRYYDYTFDEERGLSSIRESELKKTAADFLRTTVPQLADRLILSESDNYGNTRYTFDRYENGIRVENSRAYVYVSRTTGKVRNYSLSWDFDSEFTLDSGISADEAYSVLANEAVRIEYRIFDDKAIPVYILDNGVYAALDGSTFSPSAYSAYKFAMNESATAMDSAAESDTGASGGGRSYRLTSEEIAAVEQMNSLISRERIEEIIASMPELSLPEDYSMSLRYNAVRYEDHTEYRVVAMLDANDGYGELTLDAESGELLNFYSYSDKDWRYVEEEDIDDADVLAAAGQAFISRLKNLDGYRLSGEAYNGARYERYVGEIPYPADYKSVTLSAATGKVTRYSQNTPTAEIVIPASLTDKLNAVKNNYSTELVYAYRIEAEEGSPVLAWKLNPNFEFYFLRAEDGAPVNYRNEKAEPRVNKTNETTHYAWNAFEILRENGITLPGGYSFDDEITKGDFRSLIQQLTGIDAVPYRYYFIDEDEEAVLRLPIDREEAARMVAEQMSWDPLIDLNIYSVSFADAADFSGGIGAAAILYGMGVMQGNGSGSFMPKEKLTYGEAFMITFNLASLNLNMRW